MHEMALALQIGCGSANIGEFQKRTGRPGIAKLHQLLHGAFIWI